MYQNTVLSNNAHRKSLLFTSSPLEQSVTVESDNEPWKDNLYFYTNERRRKRHVNVNVKKYEA